jgi:hypothetical protein
MKADSGREGARKTIVPRYYRIAVFRVIALFCGLAFLEDTGALPDRQLVQLLPPSDRAPGKKTETLPRFVYLTLISASQSRWRRAKVWERPTVQFGSLSLVFSSHFPKFTGHVLFRGQACIDSTHVREFKSFLVGAHGGCPVFPG